MDHSQDCFPGPGTISVARRLAIYQWLWNQARCPQTTWELQSHPNPLNENIWARGLENSPDSSLMEWLEHTGSNYSKFPSASKTLWLWGSRYRITNLVTQVCWQENTHFLLFLQIFFLIHFTHLLDTYYVKVSAPNALRNKISATKSETRLLAWGNIQERRGENALKISPSSPSTLPGEQKVKLQDRDPSKFPPPLQALAGPHVIVLWPRDTCGYSATRGYSALLSASPGTILSSAACSQDLAGDTGLASHSTAPETGSGKSTCPKLAWLEWLSGLLWELLGKTLAFSWWRKWEAEEPKLPESLKPSRHLEERAGGCQGPSQGDPSDKAKRTESRVERNQVLMIAYGPWIQPCLQPGLLLGLFSYMSEKIPFFTLAIMLKF